MEKILSGVRRFQAEIFPAERELFERLANRQKPLALFLTCSDSRIVPEKITQTGPGDLFVCRNAGNLVPKSGTADDAPEGTAATIEYAVAALEVRDIVICGHSDCGAMKALLEPGKLSGMPAVAAWLRHAERASRYVEEHAGEARDAGFLKRVAEENVMGQMENLLTYEAVRTRVEEGALKMHGWYYDIGSGAIAVTSGG